MTALLKNLGVLIIVIAALLLILASLNVAGLGEMLDQNLYTWGCVGALVVGLILHIWMNKKYQD
jgi:hypothetical protein